MDKREDLLLQLRFFLLDVYNEENNVAVLQRCLGYKDLKVLDIICIKDYSIEVEENEVILTIKSNDTRCLVFVFKGDISLEETDDYVIIISDNNIVKLEIF